MLNDLRETVELFSLKSMMTGNYIGNSTSFPAIGVGGSGAKGMISGARRSTASLMASDKFLRTYYLKLQELQDYEITELTNTIVGILRDYIASYLNKEYDIITFKGAVKGNELYKRQLKINKIFKDLGLVEEIKSHLPEIIYNGQYCIKIDWDAVNRKFVKYNLENPYNVVSVLKKGILHCHLVVSRDGKIVEVAPNTIIRFGKSDFHLINDMNISYFDEDEDTIVKSYEFITGQPLYYNLTNKIKEFLLKEQIVSLLSIKDLIQPLLLLLKFDKTTAPDEGNKMALHTENLINKHSDITGFLAPKFSITDLVDTLQNNIRVLPDWSSAMGDMGSIDLSKITNKIAEIKGDQEQSKDAILTSLGIPRTLFAGDVHKWEAIKTSERLNSKVTSYINQLKDGLAYTASMFYYLLTKETFKVEDIECSLFKKTQVDYNTQTSNGEIINNLLGSVNGVLESAQNIISNNQMINPKKYCEYTIDLLKEIDPKTSTFIGPKEIEAVIKNSPNNESNDEEGGGEEGAEDNIDEASPDNQE